MLLQNAFTTLFMLPYLFIPFVFGQNVTEHAFNRRRTLSIGIVIFDGFEPIEVWGPLEFLTSVCYTSSYLRQTSLGCKINSSAQLSAFYKMTLSVISYNKGPVKGTVSARLAQHLGGNFGQTLGAETTVTHTFDDAPALDVIIVPGGTGVINATLGNQTIIEEFLVRREPQADYVLGISFGVTHLARSGLLNGKRATTNKSGWEWIKSYGPQVEWVPQARWVTDGKFWTSSGMTSAMDMTYAWLTHIYGAEGPVDERTNGIEYAPHLNSEWDPYAVYFNVSGADAGKPMKDCVGPVGLPGNLSVSRKTR